MTTLGTGTLGSGTLGNPGGTTHNAPTQTRPSLALGIEIEGPDGITARFTADETDRLNLIEDLEYGTRTGTGYTEARILLSRNIFEETDDLPLLSTLRIRDNEGTIVYEGRIQSTPGTQTGHRTIDLRTIPPATHLENRTITCVIIDRRTDHWQEAPVERKAAILTEPAQYGAQFQITAERGQILVRRERDKSIQTGTRIEHWYSFPDGETCSQIQYDMVTSTNTGNSEATIRRTDTLNMGTFETTTLTGGGLQTITPTPRRHVALSISQTSTATPTSVMQIKLDPVAVYGNHPVTLTPLPDGTHGITVPELIRYIATRCNMNIGHIDDPEVILEQAAWREDTYPIRIIEETLTQIGDGWNFAVRENNTVELRRINLAEPDWIVRTDNPQVRITAQGDTATQRRNGITVVYEDTDYGPSILRPTNHPELRIDDPTHPANIAGIELWGEPLKLDGRHTREQALRLGHLALADEQRPRVPTTLEITGYVTNPDGADEPVTHMRDGHTIAIVDAGYSQPRLIREVRYQHRSRTATVSVEQPSNRIDSVFARIAHRLEAAGL